MNLNDTVVFYSSTTNNIYEPWTQKVNADCRYSFLNVVLGTLMAANADGTIIPSTLESYGWNFKKKYYELKLKDNLYFQNGRKVNSKDLEFTLLRYFFVKTPNIESTILTNILGTHKFLRDTQYQSGLVEGVKILDERTVAVTLESPNPTFLYTIARSNFGLIPQEELKDDLYTWKKWPIGVGPYKIIEENKEKKYYKLELVQPTEYPKAPKYIIYELEKTFVPDVSLKDETLIKNEDYAKKQLFAPLLKRVFTFNYANELGRNPIFRQAVNLALNRNEITKETTLKTIPVMEFILPGNIGRINIQVDQNIEKAKSLFKQVLKNNFSKFVYKIPFSDDHYLGSEYRNVIQKQFAECGFLIEFVRSSNVWDTFTPNGFPNSPMEMTSNGVDFYDPLLGFTLYRKGSPAINKYPPNDAKLELLIDTAKHSANRDVLSQNLKELSKYYAEKNILVNLFEIPTVVSYNPKKIIEIGNQFGGISFFYLQNLQVK